MTLSHPVVYHARRVALVLYYHRVGPFADGQPRKMNVEPETFRHQLETVARRCRFMSINDLVDAAPPDAAAVTFDDGYRDVVAHALPVLREMRIPATFFIVAGAVGGTDTWYYGREAIVSWDDLKRWVDAGMAVGSHGQTHERLDRMPPERARGEIVESKRLLEEKLGVPVKHFSYPQGKRAPEVERMVAEAGYRAAWGTKSAPDGQFARRRIRLSANDRGFRFAFKLWKFRWGLY